MDKKELFKNFIGAHPEILKYIKNKEMTFQDFFEIYDIYGEESNVWDKYFKDNIETMIDVDKQSLALSRVEDYFTVRLYGKLESKLYMELELRDNNLLNKAREGYIRYHQIVEKTEDREEIN